MPHPSPSQALSSATADLAAARLREAALREILDLIRESPEHEGPVFDVILHRAARLCGAHAAALVSGQAGDPHQRLVAQYGLAADSIGVYERGEVSMDPDVSIAARAILTRTAIHIPDMMDTDGYRNGVGHYVSAVRDTGVRSQLFVPLISAQRGAGCILVNRKEFRPFNPDEIALVEAFAAQAVIAIENVRQFRELQGRLAREAATREILEVISHSRDNDRPVFDAILQNATRLCGADSAALLLGTPEGPHLTLAALWAWDSLPPEALDRFITDINRVPMQMDPALHISARAICTGRVVHIHDLAQTEGYLSGEASFKFMVEDQGVRTTLSVPIFDTQGPIGCISVHRNEVRPYSGDEIALIQSFAAQAVIAIENVRQFRELQMRLAREAATREILEVISESRDDDRPVFDVVLRKAAELCHASLASLFTISEDRSHVVLVAEWGHDQAPGLIQVGVAWPMNSDLGTTTCMRAGQIVHLHDLADTDLYRSGDPVRVAAVDEDGIRTFLAVPLFSGGQTVGCITIYRREVRPFTPDEIALVETFAAQAVIAIENVRQFRELQTRLAREAATREILEVISQSRDDDRPVFDAVLRNANRLCGTSMAYLALGRPDDTHMTLAAYVNPHLPSQDAVDQIIAFANQSAMRMNATEHFSAKAILSGKVVQIADIATTPGYLSGEPTTRILVEDVGVRTILSVPMFDAQSAIGAISLQRREERPFSDDEVALIQSFAAQAVIAIENVRQFKALEALNAELESRVQEQVGEIERMGRLKRFLPAAVADTVISSGSEKMLSSHRALLGVLFADIRGFTSFCETAEPEETIEVLQTYHEEMGKLIAAHGAGVDHRMGDGIMVLFNDPLPCDDPAGDAVRLAMAMRARMAELCKGWKRMGHKLGFGLGVSLGYATVGMVGSGGRFDYTASGTAINLASRLCDEAQDSEILISPRARTAVEEDFTVESRGEISFKGIREPVEVFCVTGVVG